jgi:hypothetical protein
VELNLLVRIMLHVAGIMCGGEMRGLESSLLDIEVSVAWFSCRVDMESRCN